jgi:hypothetical protein
VRTCELLLTGSVLAVSRSEKEAYANSESVTAMDGPATLHTSTVLSYVLCGTRGL